MRGAASRIQAHRVFISRARKTGRQARLRLRSDCRDLRIFPRRGSAADSSRADEGRSPGGARNREARARYRSPPGRAHHSPHVPETHRKNCWQARGAHPELSHASVIEAGALFGGESRPLRARGQELHALHLADPEISGSDRAPDIEGSITRGSPPCRTKRDKNGAPNGRERLALV